MMTDADHIHMTGIGGIGMSALAQLLAHERKTVRGTDRDRSPITDMLQDIGITISTPHAPEALTDNTDALIYSAAVPADNPERAAARARGIAEYSYFEAIGEISRTKRTIAIAGTHGKTTTAAMLVAILRAAGKSPTAIVGSVMREGGSNYCAGDSNLFVVEACEYQRHMLHIHPAVSVVTNIELDHTDYFSDVADVADAFHAFLNQTQDAIVTDCTDTIIGDVISDITVPVLDYTTQPTYTIPQPGVFNQANARAAAAAAQAAYPDITTETIHAALETFKGTWRRFEHKGNTAGGALVFDDYAHHPTALRHTIAAVRQAYPGKNVIVAFHPHLFSRTATFFSEFADALKTADTAYVLPIYPAREQQDAYPNVSAEALAAESGATYLPNFSAAEEQLATYDAENVVITMGAGDIYKVADAIT